MNTIPVLDHGYVTLLNIAGPTRRVGQMYVDDFGEAVFGPPPAFDADDTDPANVARKSFDNSNSGRSRTQDLQLADYLIRQSPPHSEPFEFIECWFEMKLPLFVAAQMKRHRTARIFEPSDDIHDPSIDEISLRYVQSYPQFYVPTRFAAKPTNAKQGKAGLVPEAVTDLFRTHLIADCEQAYAHYTQALDAGIAPEHARLFLHVNNYTGWVWKQDLWNMFHFLACRDHPHAQEESRAYAKAVDTLLRNALPELMNLYDKYRK